MRLLSRLMLALLSCVAFTGPAKADFGDACSPISLNQSLASVKAHIATFQPKGTMLVSGKSCVAGVEVVGANWSPVCLMGGNLEVVLISAIGRYENSRLSRLTMSIPYAREIEADLIKQIGGTPVSLKLVENPYTEGVRSAQLFLTDDGASHTLLTEEKGPLAQSNRYYYVVRTSPADDDGSLAKELLACTSRSTELMPR